MDNWRADAACQEVDPDLFFPVGMGSPALAQAERAKKVCRRCPVQQECLREAMAEPQPPAGVWGGLTEAERGTLRQPASREAAARR
ncbi:WhiB family transcriptional regulator [Streptomyces sp. NPDC058486]|uniref:WhiB family transcriptional regulator n=1 Tax=unclassified Streptomyces TaxID=2593676 RepID=UPI003651B1F9